MQNTLLDVSNPSNIRNGAADALDPVTIQSEVSKLSNPAREQLGHLLGVVPGETIPDALIERVRQRGSGGISSILGEMDETDQYDETSGQVRQFLRDLQMDVITEEDDRIGD